MGAVCFRNIKELVLLVNFQEAKSCGTRPRAWELSPPRRTRPGARANLSEARDSAMGREYRGEEEHADLVRGEQAGWRGKRRTGLEGSRQTLAGKQVDWVTVRG